MHSPLPDSTPRPNVTKQTNRILWRKPWAVLTVPFALLFVFLISFALASILQFQVTVRPQFVMEGGQVTVSCTVPRNMGNRQLSYGLVGPNESMSTYELFGENSKVTWDVTVHKLTCGDYVAFCDLVRLVDGKEQRQVRQARLTVLCPGDGQ